MALGFSLLDDVPTTSGADSYTSSSITPTGMSHVAVGVLSSGTVDTTVPALDSPTWLDGAWEGPYRQGDTSTEINVWVGKVVGSPGADTVTVSFTDPVSDPQTGCHIVIVGISSADTTDPVVQTKGASGTGTTGTVTLDSAMGSADNHHLAFIGHEVNEVHGPADGEAELADNGFNSPTRRMSVQHKANDTSSASSWATSADWEAVGLEIRAAVAGGSTKPKTLLSLGIG